MFGFLALLREESQKQKQKDEGIDGVSQDLESKVQRRIKRRSLTSKKGSIEAKVRSRSDREAT